jgi:MYXO-CTERM domain-containing protein
MQGVDARGRAEMVASDRSTTFSAADDEGPPASMKAFGVVFGALWLGMLALVFITRRRQLRLKRSIEATERSLFAPTTRV